MYLEREFIKFAASISAEVSFDQYYFADYDKDSELM